MFKVVSCGVVLLLLSTYAWATFEAGMTAYRAGDFTAAAREFADAAEQGDKTSQFNLGLMYANGRGVAKDDSQAVRWFHKAAEQGYAAAEAYLGFMYADGRGVAKDDTQAAQWFRKAAERGDASAQSGLGVMYAEGRGVAKDDVQAVQWSRKGAEQGYAQAQFNLGVMYAEGRGLAKDDAQAIQWFRKAGAQGHADAIERMARVLTELDPDVTAFEIKGQLYLLGATRFVYRYRAPNEYVLAAAISQDSGAYVEVASNRALIYDPRSGRMLALEDTAPTFKLERDSTNRLQAGYGIGSTKPESSDRAARVRIDLPSLLEMSRAGTRKVEPVADKRYRLTYIMPPDIVFIYSVDLSTPITFTGLEVRKGAIQVVKVEFAANELSGPTGVALPELQTVAAEFEVLKPVLEGMRGLSEWFNWMAVPVLLGATTNRDSVRDEFDKAMGERHDWDIIEANYKRDLSKLKQLMPMPEIRFRDQR